ncbi:uncharacterized protein BDZ99DRAFT_564730 [Mytilinidion resinicola]|uniref:Homeodomain-like protein n=1 Tax=Mytilinidion resinicola TaxID=574789 RepID=A0A6A6Z7X6_9PEZI|nr:uncharacterized protein BDZ99DRAFT_564730 [Mytilinidion resinicola]KAF2816908.1 hypothetical protein BDZ99DRAFT_564730 [Mytilinidion resinicola]
MVFAARALVLVWLYCSSTREGTRVFCFFYKSLLLLCKQTLFFLSVFMARQPRKWTTAEDQVLKAEVSMQLITGEVKDWCRYVEEGSIGDKPELNSISIASSLPGRTNKDCRKRWHNAVAGGLKKGQWAKSEDVLLTTGVERHGQRWTLVAEIVGSRSADQCAKRWQQSLNPELDLSEWKAEEDELLLKAVERYGRHWKEIQHAHFASRSKNCIKNRWTVLLRRSQHQGLELFSRDRGSLHFDSLEKDLEDESIDSDGMDDDSGVSVSFGRSPRTPSFDHCSSLVADDSSSMSWTPSESVCASTNGSDLGNLTSISVDNNFEQIDFAAATSWPWQESMADPSLYSGVGTVGGYAQPGFDSFDSSQSAYSATVFPGRLPYNSSPSMSNYPSGLITNGNSTYACSSPVQDSQSAVEVTLRFNKPDTAMMNNLMNLVRVERDV